MTIAAYHEKIALENNNSNCAEVPSTSDDHVLMHSYESELYISWDDETSQCDHEIGRAELRLS